MSLKTNFSFYTLKSLLCGMQIHAFFTPPYISISGTLPMGHVMLIWNAKLSVVAFDFLQYCGLGLEFKFFDIVYRPPLFKSPENSSTPSKPPKPSDCVSILISLSPPTSHTTAKTMPLLDPSSSLPILTPAHIQSSQPCVKITYHVVVTMTELHSNSRRDNDDVDFAIPPKPPDQILIQTSSFLLCWSKLIVQHYMKEGKVLIAQIDIVAAILCRNVTIGHNCFLSNMIWIYFLVTDEKSMFPYEPYDNDTGSSCGVYPYLNMCYCHHGDICYPHHASNFGNDIIADGFEIVFWPESDSFVDDILTKKITIGRQGTFEYSQSSNASRYTFELIRVRSSITFELIRVRSSIKALISMHSATDIVGMSYICIFSYAILICLSVQRKPLFVEKFEVVGGLLSLLGYVVTDMHILMELLLVIYLDQVVLNKMFRVDDIRVVQLVNGVNKLTVWARNMRSITLDAFISCSHASAIVALLKKFYPHWSHTAFKVGVLSTAFGMANSKEVRKLLIVEVTQDLAFLFLDGTLSYVKELASYFAFMLKEASGENLSLIRAVMDCFKRFTKVVSSHQSLKLNKSGYQIVMTWRFNAIASSSLMYIGKDSYNSASATNSQATNSAALNLLHTYGSFHFKQWDPGIFITTKFTTLRTRLILKGKVL
jgi:hypothetical protein